MSSHDDNRTMPWTDDEMIKFGKYKLAYHFEAGSLMPLLPGGRIITYKELYKYGHDITLPKIIRQSPFGGRSKY